MITGPDRRALDAPGVAAAARRSDDPAPAGGGDDVAAARHIADAAGRLLLELRERDGDQGRSLGARADHASNALILDELARAFPDDAVLSEESADDPSRLEAGRVWIVDPLDGTREYGELGRTDWAVHVALWAHGELVAGAVALPAVGRTLTSDSASLPAPHPAPARSRMVVSRTRPPEVTGRIRDALDAELVPMGSAGAKAMAVVLGAADVYAHAGGQYEWDSAAPVAVARAAGLHASRLDGSPLRYNRRDPWLPDLLICRGDHAQRVLDAVAG